MGIPNLPQPKWHPIRPKRVKSAGTGGNETFEKDAESSRINSIISVPNDKKEH